MSEDLESSERPPASVEQDAAPVRRQREEPAPSRELHRRTWELELLISGAVVVALLQLPGMLDTAWARFSNQASRDLHLLGWYVYFPLKMALSPAIGIFLVHVLIRGMWVGLVGLNAVFPDGPKVEKLDFGPIQERFFRDRLDLPLFEDRLDRIASTLFSVLFSLLALFSALAVWVGTGMALVLVVRTLGFAPSFVTTIQIGYLLPILLVFLPGGVGAIADRIAARRGLESGRVVSFARAATRFYWVASLAFLWYPTQATLISNLTRRKVRWWKAALVGMPIGILLPLLVVLPLLAPRLTRELDSWIWAPDDPGAAGLSIRSYADERGGLPLRGPVVDSVTPTGAYLEVFLPYEARRDNARLSEVCPNVEAFRLDGDVAAALGGRASGTPDQRSAVLECFGRLWTLELDGEVVEAEFLFGDAVEHRNGEDQVVPGVVTMLDLRGLAEGRHDLVAQRRPTVRETERKRYRAESHRFHVPFWL